VHPLEAVREELAGARRHGAPFDEAWPAAIDAAPLTWRLALEETRDTWAGAYTGAAATSGGQATIALSAVMAVVRLRDDHAATAERRHGRSRRFEIVA
jgi:hypothetical protein